MAESHDLTREREEFQTQQRANHIASQNTADGLSRRLVTLMDQGEGVTLDNFIFALSMGKLNAFSEQDELLREVEGLAPNKVVGIATTGEKSVLKGLGTVAVSPLDLFVSQGRSDRPRLSQPERVLQACIRLNNAVCWEDYHMSSLASPKDDVTVVMVGSRGEAGYTDAQLRNTTTNRLLVGTRAVLEHVMASGDKRDLNQATDFVQNLAYITTHQPAPVA